MAIIRISHWNTGIEKYLETGQKQGRELSRDELDYRLPISGDIDAFSMAVKHSKSVNDWQHQYDHLTVGFSLGDNQKVDDKIMAQIVDDILGYYYPTHNKEQLIHHAEAHLPRHQSVIDQSSGTLIQRLGHIHIAVARYDLESGTQVRTKPANHLSDSAFQTYINQKYQLDDPQQNERFAPAGKKQLLARDKGDLQDLETLSKQTQVAKSRKDFSKLLENVNSLDEITELLNKCEHATNVRLVETQKNTYFKVHTTHSERAINLRGKGFEHLNILYAQAYSLSKAKKSEKTTEKKPEKHLDAKRRQAHERTLEENRKIWQASQKWWREQCQNRKAKNSQSDDHFNYEKTHQRYESFYDKYTTEQRRFFVMYRDNIAEHLVSGFNLFDNQSNKYLVNNRKSIKIYDKPNQITLELPESKQDRLDAIRLSFRMAESKGWDINHLEVTGSEEFRNETLQCIEELNQLRKIQTATWQPKSTEDLTPEDSSQKPKTSRKPNKYQTALNSAKHVLDKANDTQETRHTDLDDLKHQLGAQSVIDYAVQCYGVNPGWYQASTDNKIKDTRLNMSAKSTIEFMTKVCNLRFTDAKAALQELIETQQNSTALETFGEAVESNPTVKEEMFCSTKSGHFS